MVIPVGFTIRMLKSYRNIDKSVKEGNREPATAGLRQVTGNRESPSRWPLALGLWLNQPQGNKPRRTRRNTMKKKATRHSGPSTARRDRSAGNRPQQKA